MTFHYRERGPSGELLGIFMLDRREEGQNNVYLAETGIAAKVGDQNYLVLETGTIQRQDKGSETPAMIVFDSYALDLSHFGSRADGAPLRPRERTTSDMLNYSVGQRILCEGKRGPVPRGTSRAFRRPALRSCDGNDRFRRVGRAAHHPPKSRRGHDGRGRLRAADAGRRIRRLGDDGAVGNRGLPWPMPCRSPAASWPRSMLSATPCLVPSGARASIWRRPE